MRRVIPLGEVEEPEVVENEQEKTKSFFGSSFIWILFIILILFFIFGSHY